MNRLGVFIFLCCLTLSIFSSDHQCSFQRTIFGSKDIKFYPDQYDSKTFLQFESREQTTISTISIEGRVIISVINLSMHDAQRRFFDELKSTKD